MGKVKQKTLSIAGIFFVVLTSIGCSPQPSPTSNIASQGYSIEILDLSEPVYETISVDEIDQPNCNGIRDVDSVVERTRAIYHSIELGLGLTVDADGKLELLGTGVNLGAAISTELGYQYGETESISRSVTVRAAPQTHMKHRIRLSEVWETGTARVNTSDQSLDIPFRFRTTFSVDLIESIRLSCETSTPEIPSLPTLDPALGMHAILSANQTSGNRPLDVRFDARESFFIAPDGTRFDCGACDYFWQIRKDGATIFGPMKDNAVFVHKFENRGTYYVSVYVCRSGSNTECNGTGMEIIVN